MKYLILIIIMITVPIFGLKIEDNTIKDSKVEKKVPEKKESEKKEKKKKAPRFTFRDKNEKYTNDITPKADESGRVFIIPGIDYNMSLSSKVDDLLIFGSDVEYLTEYMNERLAIYGNLGFGLVSDFFLLHLEAGLKYNLPRVTRFMKVFIKQGLTINPYFTSSKVYTPIASTTGIGFKFFINSAIAVEQSNEFQIGNQVNNSTLYMSMRFKLSAILIF